jgi:hypothetical protein
VLSKLHAHVSDYLHYGKPAPYNQQLIDTLRLEPAACLPGASLNDACEHFREHHARIFDPDCYEALEDTRCGPKWDWCIVIDDQALNGIDGAPEPIGHVLPEGLERDDLIFRADTVRAKLLSKSYSTMKEPRVLSAAGRGGAGPKNVWVGWLEFTPDELMGVFTEADGGGH